MAQNKPTKETISEKLFRSTLFWLGVILYVALPFANSFVLQTVIINVSGNIAYTSLTPTLKLAQNLIDVFIAYAGIALIAVSIANFGAKKAKGTVILGISHHFIGFLFSISAYALSGATNYTLAAISLGSTALINTAVYGCIALIVSGIRRSKQKHATEPCPQPDKRIIGKGGVFSYVIATVGAFAAFKLIYFFAVMISEFLDPSLGVPINLGEWMYWVTELLKVLIYAAIGYLITLGAFHMADYYKKHFE